VLVVAVRTAFCRETGEETGTMLDPVWTTEHKVSLSGRPFKDKYAENPRAPARVEVVEKLNNALAAID
jgi:hypothetical protein